MIKFKVSSGFFVETQSFRVEDSRIRSPVPTKEAETSCKCHCYLWNLQNSILDLCHQKDVTYKTLPRFVLYVVIYIYMHFSHGIRLVSTDLMQFLSDKNGLGSTVRRYSNVFDMSWMAASARVWCVWDALFGDEMLPFVGRVLCNWCWKGNSGRPPPPPQLALIECQVSCTAGVFLESGQTMRKPIVVGWGRLAFCLVECFDAIQYDMSWLNYINNRQ